MVIVVKVIICKSDTWQSYRRRNSVTSLRDLSYCITWSAFVTCVPWNNGYPPHLKNVTTLPWWTLDYNHTPHMLSRTLKVSLHVTFSKTPSALSSSLRISWSAELVMLAFAYSFLTTFSGWSGRVVSVTPTQIALQNVSKGEQNLRRIWSNTKQT